MGLDVTAYRKMERVADWPDGAESIDDVCEYASLSGYTYNGVQVTDISPSYDTHMPARRATLTSGLYSYAEKTGMRAGSYSGYNAWRDWLARARYGMTDHEVWARCKTDPAFEDGAALLINFSDCEGYIDAPTSARILADLRAHEAQIRAAVSDDWYVTKFDEWLALLEVAADGGMLDFH